VRWVEIIDVRSLSHEEALLEPELPALLSELAAEREPERIEMYRHAELRTDWSIHIHYTSDSQEPVKSLLGLRLVALMREFGFVHHGIWREARKGESHDVARPNDETV
jgi:hypothetical protein